MQLRHGGAERMKLTDRQRAMLERVRTRSSTLPQARGDRLVLARLERLGLVAIDRKLGRTWITDAGRKEQP